MDQEKIGRFIATCRKKQNLTQMQLAQMLNITDRAVSKWERGKSLPDYAIMLKLCDILKISVNDLLSGEVVSMENYNQELENNLLEMIKQKEDADKRLLLIEIVMVIIAIIPIIIAIILVHTITMNESYQIMIVLVSLIPLLLAAPFAIKIEQKAGSYECTKCKHRYVPKYNKVFWAIHINRTRYMRCPNCNKYSWQKKVINKKANR